VRPALRTGFRWLFGLLFVAAGVNHFRDPATYVRIMPPYLPGPRALVYASGVGEILLGGLLLVPRFRRAAAWGLIALLVAVFPANVHMALHPAEFPRIPPAVLWARLPFQGVLIAWAYLYTRPTPASQSKFQEGVAARGPHNQPRPPASIP
jgi:uncharacterized membrane protein